jgi:hypothetical protein
MESPVKIMRDIKEEIKTLLTNYPDYRDNDTKLIAAFYYTIYGGKSVFENKSALQFLKEFAEGRYIFPDTITRIRRMIQEDNEHLRGSKYYERKKLDKDTKQNINNV